MRWFGMLFLLFLPPLVAAQDPTAEVDEQALAAYRVARQAWLEPGLTTCLDDANTDVAFLDDFQPPSFHPLAEMPRIEGYGYVLAVPGCYELDAPTFCLHAGSYGPGGGDGYALARLRGKTAAMVHEALWGWTKHPEIPQGHVQVIVWALAERRAISELPAERQAVALALLGAEGVAAANAAARGPEPSLPGLDDPTLFEPLDALGASVETTVAAYQAQMDQAQRQVEDVAGRMERGEQVPMEELQAALQRLQTVQTAMFERLGPALQQAAEAQARFGKLIVTAEAAFEELEREALLHGDPEPPEGSRPIPEARWSYHPGGFFIRYFPEDYSRSRVEVSVPPAVTLERDAEGRIATVADERGNRLQVVFAAGPPAPVPGDAGLKASGVREIRLTPAGAHTLVLADNWTFTGIPGGSAAPEVPGFDGSAERYGRAREHLRDISWLVAAMAAPDGRPPAEVPLPADIADLVDLAHLVESLRPGVPPGDETAPEALAYQFLQEAWQSALCRRVAALPGAKPPGMAVRSPEGLQLATLGLPRAFLTQAASGGLSALDPGWDGMNPGNRARQRLGTAPMQHPDSDGKQVLRKAVAGCELLSAALDVFNGLTDPVTWLMEKMGLGAGGMPGMMLSEMVQALFDAAAAISQALGGDPPRDDFREFTLPPVPELLRVEVGDGMSAARAHAANAAATGLCDLYVSLRAAQISLDRLGGALRAGDAGWARKQALAFVHHKRQSGALMIAAAEQYQALLEIMQDEGDSPEGIELARLQAQQQRLRDQGLRAETVAALRQLGMSDPEIEAVRQRRLAFNPEDDLDDPLALAGDVAGVLTDLGEYWLKLPDVAAPAP